MTESNELFDLLTKHPKVGFLVIATVFSALGFGLKTVIEYLLDLRRKKAELRELFWKEKIQSAKKASEYYYEHLSLLNLLVQNIETEINEKQFSEVIVKSFNEKISNLSDRITNPKHYEHHHIHIFYNFDESRLNELNRLSIETMQDLETYTPNENDTFLQFQNKLEMSKPYLKKLMDNHKESIKIYRDYLDVIRTDIKKFVE